MSLSGIIAGSRARGGGPSFGLASRSFGLGNYLSVANPLDISTDDLTIAFWAKVESLPNLNAVASISNSSSDGSPSVLINSDVSAYTIRGYVGGYFGASSITLDTWHHITLTLGAGGTKELFMDAVSVGTTTNSPSANQNSLWIGTGYNRQWPGKIADFRLYDSVLSGANITSLAAGSDVAGMIGWWMLDTDDLLDHSGNGLTLTETGTTTYSTDGPLDP